MRPILEIQNISKRFVIDHERMPYYSFRDRLTSLFKSQPIKEEFWALKDVSFNVLPGDSVGIIGRNGAGKSTLLKILSRITPPTSGRIISRGRIASLLEVGTGFHQELTGRENIFMNGSILGMKNVEIKARFDEIVEFSGVEKFLDTPLKHYSSGMQLRLAFAVAAHLEPEVLIIDEVLAVGDAEFQKKCMGKMEDVSNSGRTILFVSHNMTAVRKLCKSAVLLADGKLSAVGSANQISDLYLAKGLNSSTEKVWPSETDRKKKIQFLRASVYANNQSPHDPIKTTDDVVIEVDFFNHLHESNIDVTFDIFDSFGNHLTHFGMVCHPQGQLPSGAHRTTSIFPRNILNTNKYFINILFGLNQYEILAQETEVLTFEVVDDIAARGSNFSKLPGIIHPICESSTVPLLK